MSKPYLTFFLIGISLCLIQSALADCRDKTLYCFDSKDFRLGEISVGQVNITTINIIVGFKLEILNFSVGNGQGCHVNHVPVYA